MSQGTAGRLQTLTAPASAVFTHTLPLSIPCLPLQNKSIARTSRDEDHAGEEAEATLKQSALDIWSTALQDISLPISQQLQLAECGYKVRERESAAFVLHCFNPVPTLRQRSAKPVSFKYHRLPKAGPISVAGRRRTPPWPRRWR